MPRQWKENPPGDEQKLLEQLFREGFIDDCDTASKVYYKYPEFKDNYSERVFSTHFRSTKAKMGLFARGNGRNQSDDDNFGGGSIVELGAIGQDPSASLSRQTNPSLGLGVGIQFQNAPYITWVYTDHIKKYDYVCVAVPVISGSRKITFAVSDDGQTLHVHYLWPTAVYTPTELFADLLKGDDPIKIDHPKIHAYTSRLLELDLTEKSNPSGVISIALPIKVQRESHTFTKLAVKSNNTNVVLVEFQAYQKKQYINDADTSINFD